MQQPVIKHRDLLIPGLLAWYLLLPHYRVDGSLMDHAPLSQWKIHDRYDSLIECETVRKELLDDATEVLRDQEKRAELSPAPQTAVLLAAKCVSTDDLRLKEK